MQVRTGIQSGHSHRLIIPDDVLIKFDLLMMSTWRSKHVEIWNEQINTWNTASRWLLTRICDEMRGQQNADKYSLTLTLYVFAICFFYIPI
jgi:hypothetical protein